MSQFDVFISHASEDKTEVARPLATLLIQAGLSVWLDESELSLGDSLRRNIDHGLAASRFGVVILSKAFFSKEWPQKELDALVAREDGKSKVILPIWHNLTQRDVASYSPLLADRLGARTEQGLQSVVASILQAVRGTKGEPAQQSQRTESPPTSTRRNAGPKRIDQLVKEFIDHVSGVIENNHEISGVPTGFHDLDRRIGGLAPGELYVLASRPAMGSTTLALNAAAHIAIPVGVPVLYFSPHARSDELLSRLIALTGRTDRRGLASGHLSDEEWARLADAVKTVHEAPMYLDDSTPLSVSDIVTRSREVKQSTGAIGLIAIDSFELLAASETPQASEGRIRQLRDLARELESPVLLLMSVPRLAEERADKRPIMRDLAFGEAIEQNACAVLFLYRDEYYRPDTLEPGIVELIVAQNRGGETGTIKLALMKSSGRMENLAY